jgi:hypothetical protein
MERSNRMHDEHTDPGTKRLKLRERVGAHVAALSEAQLDPNRTVVLGGTLFHGWLLDDPFDQATSRRWLLLADGDVWYEAAYMAGPWRHDQSTGFGWLTESTPALEALLDLSLDEIRSGGSGLLASPSRSGAPCPVADRRSHTRRVGTDRRNGIEAPPGVERRRVTRRAGLDRRRPA